MTLLNHHRAHARLERPQEGRAVREAMVCTHQRRRTEGQHPGCLGSLMPLRTGLSEGLSPLHGSCPTPPRPILC